MVDVSPTRTVVALALAAVATLPGCIGWVSSTLPPALTPSERLLVGSTHFAVTVGVAREPGRATKELREQLRSTGLFDAVELVGEIEQPDLIAWVRGGPDRANPLPFLTMLTLGIVPIFAADEDGLVFSLQAGNDPFVPPDLSDPHRGPDPPERGTVRVDARYRGSVHIGWVAILTGLWPGRTLLPPSWSSRYTDSLRASICAQALNVHDLIRRARAGG